MTLVDYLLSHVRSPGNTSSETVTARGTDGPHDGTVMVVYECRRCGTSVGDTTTRCPNCDRRTIAEYPVD